MNETSLHNLASRYVDEELSAAEHAAVDAQLVEDAALRRLVAAERLLRERVDAVMGEAFAAAPADLRERVRGTLAGEEVEAASAAGSERSVLIRLFADPTHANVLAVAASLFLVAGAILFGIFAPRIDDLHSREPMTAPAAEVAQFASSEHGRCAGNETCRRDAIRYCTPSEACARLSSHVQKPVPVFDLRSDGLALEFVGGGECHLPGARQSAHLLYVAGTPDKPGPMVSVFMFPVDGISPDAPTAKEWQLLAAPPSCSKKVLARYHEGMAYLLVCCDERMLEPVAAGIEAQLTGR